MTRDEWKAFHHAIRADARAFKERHGGYPCFVRNFMHNGIEHSLTRVRDDGINWRTRLAATLVKQRPIGFFIGRCFAENMDSHYEIKRRWRAHIEKRAIRLTVEESRLHREQAA